LACPCHVARGAAPHSSAAVVRNRSRGTERFVEEHQGRIGDISVFGQESNPTTWKLAPMNLAIRGIEAHLGRKWADSFLDDQHKDHKADDILANPPFNVSDWSGYMGQNSFLAVCET